MAEVAVTTAGRSGDGGDHPSTDWLILQRLDDLRRGQDELKRDLTSRMGDLKNDLTSRMDDLKNDLTSRMDDLKNDLTSRMDRLETRVASVETRIDKIAGNERWLIGILAVAVLSMAAKLFFPAA